MKPCAGRQAVHSAGVAASSASRRRYDDPDARRRRSQHAWNSRDSPALALPRDRPRGVGAPGRRHGAASRRDRDRADPRHRRPARHGRGARGVPAPQPPAEPVRQRDQAPGRRHERVPARARHHHAVRGGRRRQRRGRQVDDRASAARAHEPLARHPAGRAGDDRRIPLPERRARPPRSHGAQGLPGVVRPARARALPHRRQERGARGPGTLLFAHEVRHRPRCARDGAPARRRDRRGPQRAAAVAARRATWR